MLSDTSSIIAEPWRSQIFGNKDKNPNQKYCSVPECRKARKRDWQKMKMQEDEAYRLNQKDSRERWAAKKPD